MASSTVAPTPVQARHAGFHRDVMSVAGRALRSIPRDPEAIYPALVIPVFFFIVNVGALQDIAEQIPGLDYRAFQLPVAIVFAVTGISRAITLVTDIQTGYFDRLALTPVSRLALLLGLTVADFALVVALSLPVLLLGFIFGVRFESGLPGMSLFVLMAGLWGLAFTGFPYAIALKTGNPAAVNVSFLLFFPFVFLTTIFVPLEAMTGWLQAIATYNPVTYLLDGLRSLITEGWDWPAILKGMGAIALVGTVSLDAGAAGPHGTGAPQLTGNVAHGRRSRWTLTMPVAIMGPRLSKLGGVTVATYFRAITDEQAALIRNAHLFFVASADPSLDEGPEGVGPVNLSPKGGVPLHVLSPNKVAYLDYKGSGNETARHATAGGPMTVMVCSFESENAAVVRLFGKATVTPLEESPLAATLVEDSADESIGLSQRQVIEVDVESTVTSCGYGVPVLKYVEQRTPERRGTAYKPARQAAAKAS